jgi:hypothetical protein
VTPFDAIALLAMLQAFYPVVTRASLERAYRERPEYFAGGRLIGRHGEALQLADGRIFDLAFAAWTPISRWQVLDVTNSEPGEPDPFALEEGPLVPLDEAQLEYPPFEPAFAPLVAQALGDVAGAELALLDAETRAAGQGDPAGTGPLDALDLEDATRAIVEERETFGALDPADVVTASAGESRRVDDAIGEIGDPESSLPQEEPLPDAGPPREDRDPRAPDRGRFPEG